MDNLTRAQAVEQPNQLWVVGAKIASAAASGDAAMLPGLPPIADAIKAIATAAMDRGNDQVGDPEYLGQLTGLSDACHAIATALDGVAHANARREAGDVDRQPNAITRPIVEGLELSGTLEAPQSAIENRPATILGTSASRVAGQDSGSRAKYIPMRKRAWMAIEAVRHASNAEEKSMSLLTLGLAAHQVSASDDYCEGGAYLSEDLDIQAEWLEALVAVPCPPAGSGASRALPTEIGQLSDMIDRAYMRYSNGEPICEYVDRLIRLSKIGEDAGEALRRAGEHAAARVAIKAGCKACDYAVIRFLKDEGTLSLEAKEVVLSRFDRLIDARAASDPAPKDQPDGVGAGGADSASRGHDDAAMAERAAD